MHDMRAIAERIVTTRARRDELAALHPQDEASRLELTALEGDVSRFDDMCIGLRRTNLCRDGCVYGQMLRHPADSDVVVVVRTGDRVEFVKGQDTPDGEISIMEATRIVVRRTGRGASVRDWRRDGDGVSLRELEDAARHVERGTTEPTPPTTERKAPVRQIPEPVTGGDRSDQVGGEPPETRPPAQARAPKARTKPDDRTIDLFG